MGKLTISTVITNDQLNVIWIGSVDLIPKKNQDERCSKGRWVGHCPESWTPKKSCTESSKTAIAWAAWSPKRSTASNLAAMQMTSRGNVRGYPKLRMKPENNMRYPKPVDSRYVQCFAGAHAQQLRTPCPHQWPIVQKRSQGFYEPPIRRYVCWNFTKSKRSCQTYCPLVSCCWYRHVSKWQMCIKEKNLPNSVVT